MRRTPVGLLFLMAFAMPLGFSTWLALLGGLAMGSLALVPLAISAALRVSLDN